MNASGEMRGGWLVFLTTKMEIKQRTAVRRFLVFGCGIRYRIPRGDAAALCL